MNNKIQEIRERHARTEQTLIDLNLPITSAVRDRKFLLSEYDRLTKVLGWYADKDNYDPMHLDTFGYIPIDKDEGKRAMAALSHIERITTPIRP